MRSIVTYILLFVASAAYSQGYSYYENSQFDPFQRQLYHAGKGRMHTSLRQYKLDEIREHYNLDSLIYDGIRRPSVYTQQMPWTGKPVSSNIFRNFIHDDFLAWKEYDKNIYVALNPYCDFQVGKDGDKKIFTNSRGFYVNGNIGKNFWFYLDFAEVQTKVPDYFQKSVDMTVLPGWNNYKVLDDGSLDFESSAGHIGFQLGQYFDFQIGKGKSFIGDGYRSLLLSDAACAYPFFKMNVTFWNVKYMLMFAQISTGDAQNGNNNGYRTKYTFTHYLDWNMGKRFSLGIFENVTMASWRVTGDQRGVDWEYLMPFVIFRAGEFNEGSPDKMLVGLNYKWILANWLTFHGQIMLNELNVKELTAGNDFWSNKYGLLFGLKAFNLFRAPGLDAQVEYSMVRPFSYSQYDGMGSYTHLRQSLAHPLGANFREVVGMVNYKHKRLAMHAQFNFAQYGDDMPTDTLSYGHNPNRRSFSRNADYGVKLLQGNKTTVKNLDLSASFLINPRNMMNFTIGIRKRNFKSDFDASDSKHIYFALRWSLKNIYYDI